MNTNIKPYNYIQTDYYKSSGFNFLFLSGFKINFITMSLEIDNDYNSYNGINNKTGKNFAFNTFRFEYSTLFNVKNRVEFKLGAGGLWFQSTFQKFTGSGWKVDSYYGVTASLNIKFFMPVSFFSFQLINKYDLMFITDEGGSFSRLGHMYYGALRLMFNPYIRWFNLYAEFGGNYILFEHEFESFNTGFFSWSLGISLDLNIPVTKYSSYKLAGDKTNLKIKEKPEEKKAYAGIYKNLYNSKVNDRIVFNNIMFEENNLILTGDSYKVLDIIAEILIETKKKVSITAYSDFMGNPLSEIELATKRGEFISNYLTGKKVSHEQLKVIFGGTIYNKKVKNDMPKIIFEIIE